MKRGDPALELTVEHGLVGANPEMVAEELVEVLESCVHAQGDAFGGQDGGGVALSASMEARTALMARIEPRLHRPERDPERRGRLGQWKIGR